MNESEIISKADEILTAIKALDNKGKKWSVEEMEVIKNNLKELIKNALDLFDNNGVFGKWEKRCFFQSLIYLNSKSFSASALEIKSVFTPKIERAENSNDSSLDKFNKEHFLEKLKNL